MIEKTIRTTKLVSVLRNRALHNAVVGESQLLPLSDSYITRFWSTNNRRKNLRLLKREGNRYCSLVMSDFTISEGEHVLPDGFKAYTKTWNVRRPMGSVPLIDPICLVSRVPHGLSPYLLILQYGENWTCTLLCTLASLHLNH